MVLRDVDTYILEPCVYLKQDKDIDRYFNQK